jgi:hypothetical protein
MTPGERRAELRALALLFLRLGATAFGGPAAHIAIREDEVVRRRGWLTREEFLDLLGATNLIPGSNSTEMAIRRLRRARRRRGRVHPPRHRHRRRHLLGVRGAAVGIALLRS